MAHYRAYIVDGADNIQRASDHDYETDEEAVAATVVLYPRERGPVERGATVKKIAAGVIVTN
jgi:hypothetical protein